MWSRRNLLIIVGVLALAGGGYYYWQQRAAAEAAAATQIRQDTVGRGTIVALVSATGPLAAEAQVNLYFGTTAPLLIGDVAVDLGDRVKQGAVLARLDTQDLELAVAQAEQSLQTAELNLAQLKTPPRDVDIAVAEANLRVAKAQVFAASQGTPKESVEIARYNLILAQNTATQLEQRRNDLADAGRYSEQQALDAQYDQALEAVQVANLRYEQAKEPASPGRAGSALAGIDQAQVALDRLKRGAGEDDLKIAELQVEQARAALELARNNLNDARILAPFEGVVAAVNTREGEIATAAFPAIVLADVRQFHIDVSVDEVDVARVAAGQLVTITLDALPNDVFAGVVDKIAPQSTVNAGVVSYAVRVRLEAEDARLRSGLTATAEIVVQEAAQVILAPNWAIRRDRDTGQAFASVLRNGEITEVPVELGLRNDAFSEILAGLSEGDVVAIQTTREQVNLFSGE